MPLSDFSINFGNFLYCEISCIYAGSISGKDREKEVVFEIERLGHYTGATSILVIYTGNLAKIETHEIVDHLCEHYLNLPLDESNAIKWMIDLCKHLLFLI